MDANFRRELETQLAELTIKELAEYAVVVAAFLHKVEMAQRTPDRQGPLYAVKMDDEMLVYTTGRTGQMMAETLVECVSHFGGEQRGI